MQLQLDFSMMIGQIAGTEWFILIVLALVLLLGPKKLPQFSRAMGKAAGEYERAKQTVRREFEQAYEPLRASGFPPVRGAVATEREKLETIAQSLGIAYQGMNDDQLRSSIAERMRN
jgi:sec-independent protein translocase protein TatA